MNSFIAPIVMIVIVILILTSTRFIKPFEKDGWKVFRPNILIGIIGGIAIGCCLFILFAYAFQLFYIQSTDVLIIGGLFAILGIPLLLIQLTIRIYINNTSIAYRSFFGKKKQIDFNEIKSIDRAASSYSEFIIKSFDNKKIRISPVYSGYLNITQIIKNNTSFLIDTTFNRIGF